MKHIIYIILSLLTSFGLTGCSSDSPTPIQQATRTVLVYVVATNSLSGNDDLDLTEMENGLLNEKVDSSARWIVYLRRYYDSPVLMELKPDRNTGKVNRKILKSYSSKQSSVSKIRMQEVIADMEKLAPASDYGLILWSHGLNWEPSKYWFGEDKGDTPVAGSGAHMDITDLSDAIPDHKFNFIWADCCYFGSIELAWQLRNKCKYYIAYPTEVMGTGCPYQLVLPSLLCQGKADVEGAARLFFNYYNSFSGMARSATITVVNTAALPQLLITMHKMLPLAPKNVSFADVINYARPGSGPSVAYYDFEGYWNALAQDSDFEKSLKEALHAVIVYKAATPYFFNTTALPIDKFSGLSTHHFIDDTSDINSYYKSLAWYDALYQNKN